MSDSELDIARRKRLLEMQKQLFARKIAEKEPAKAETKAPSDVLRSLLVGRAFEVLEVAKRQFPNEMRLLEKELGDLAISGRLQGPITGEQLYGFLRRIGLPVRMETKIRIAESGELKSIRDKLKGSE